MISKSKKKLKKIISKDRLNGYFRMVKKEKGSCDLFEAYLHYCWNIQVSECFFTPLQSLEVALRNSIQNNANKHFQNPMWFENPKILKERERENIKKAKESLRKQKKHIDPGRIVAELNLGFWTSLFYSSYENTLWRPLIKKTFPGMHPTIRKRKTLSKRLNGIRQFRNRIFHYEPIWYYNLEKRHTEIIETIGWIEPVMVEFLKPVDRFKTCSSPESFELLRKNLKTVF